MKVLATKDAIFGLATSFVKKNSCSKPIGILRLKHGIGAIGCRELKCWLMRMLFMATPSLIRAYSFAGWLRRIKSSIYLNITEAPMILCTLRLRNFYLMAKPLGH